MTARYIPQMYIKSVTNLNLAEAQLKNRYSPILAGNSHKDLSLIRFKIDSSITLCLTKN